MNDDQPDFRMMIAIGVPAFNLSSYGEGNFTGRPTLLGVAATDVPLDDLIKLALPYKLGVNGYSFIVSNNGYVLLHPDLRPFDPKHPGVIKENYNSIDIMEIEQIDEELPPRKPSEKLLELRRHLVEYRKGQMTVPVRFHYDKMRRVAQSSQTFYFAPIPHTPFSLGIGNEVLEGKMSYDGSCGFLGLFRHLPKSLPLLHSTKLTKVPLFDSLP